MADSRRDDYRHPYRGPCEVPTEIGLLEIKIAAYVTPRSIARACATRWASEDENTSIPASLTPTELSEEDDPMPTAVRQRRLPLIGTIPTGGALYREPASSYGRVHFSILVLQRYP